MVSQRKLSFRTLVNRPVKEVLAWHLRPRMLERAIPPWENIKILSSNARPDQEGSKFCVKYKFLKFFKKKVTFEYTDYVPGESFTVVGKAGTLIRFVYKNRIAFQSKYTCELTDQFECFHYFPKFFSYFIDRLMHKRISRLLTYKQEVIHNDLALLEKYPFEKPLRILMSGSHGLIGKNLFYFLEFAGHEVWHLSRSKQLQEKHSIIWNPQSGEADESQFEGFDVVINLAGENLGKGRWTKGKKERILRSRSKGTENLVDLLKKLKNPPHTFINASAVGYYGNRGDDVVNESSDPGKGLFISEVCQYWERPSKELEEVGVRVIRTRFGIVLSASGGVLKQIRRPFEYSLGGQLGSGRQYMSWISIDDVVGALYHVMMITKVQGPVNLVSPHPIPNHIFCKKLAQRLSRCLGPSLPEFMVRFLMGQKGDELLLTSTRVTPSCLIESGYTFQYPKLSQTLEHII